MADSDGELVDFSQSSPPETQSSNEKGVGLANPELQHTRRRLDIINKLQNTGIAVDIDLPQIVVIGQQSTGKSSLIEAFSGTRLPRNAGTCTRCPTECRLSRSNGPWKCEVSLRITTDSKGLPLGQAQNTKFGETIYDKSEVEERVRRAQRALLNPSAPFEKFLENPEEDLPRAEHSFSKNCISLQISGPDMADLSFCDLPGLVASGGNVNDHKLVKDLVISYIAKPSCIILVTVACETDAENQSANQLAKEKDQDGKRTIGVLTKPDRIEAGQEQDWLKFIRNEKEPLENNWYCVKQPSLLDLQAGITWEEARSQEEIFFSTTPAWSELEDMYQKYLKTPNLIARLSTILSDLISKRLPEIQLEVSKAIEDTCDALGKLPKAPSNDPLADISILLIAFSNDLKKHVDGIPDKNGLLQTIYPSQAAFRKAIRATAPDFKPYERKVAHMHSIEEPLFLKHEEKPVAVNVDGAGNSLPPTSIHEPIYIDEVMERAIQARTRELPGHHPYSVLEGFIRDFTNKWHTPAKEYCRAVNASTGKYVQNLITDHFASYGQGLLGQRVKVIAQNLLKQGLERTEAKIDWLHEIETHPYTMIDHYFLDYRDKFLAHYKFYRQKEQNGDLIKRLDPSNAQKYPQSKLSQVILGLAELGLPDLKPVDLVTLLPSDDLEPALGIMAGARAYFQVAYKRFLDNVALAVDHELLQGCKEEMLQTLFTGLKIHGPRGQELCAELARESPQLAGRREELQKKLKRLQNANDELLAI